jgi:stage II sporulation protein AB (anti-sigma F factor)
MKPLNKFAIKFPSKSNNEGFARAVVSAFAAQLDPTIEEISDIKTAVSEAVTNCIVHAYKNAVGEIYISCEQFDSGLIRIKIRDKGCGIEDVKAARVPLFTTDAANERSGMGFTVMESFCDTVRVRSKVGKGTCVTLFKIFEER